MSIDQANASDKNWWSLLRITDCSVCRGTGWGPLRGFFGCGGFRRKCEHCDGTGNNAAHLINALMWSTQKPSRRTKSNKPNFKSILIP